MRFDKIKKTLIQTQDMIVGYDIRGIYGKDIRPESFFRFGYLLKGKRWIVSGDTRASTHVLLYSLISGMLASEKDIFFLENSNIGYAVFSGIRTKRKIAYITASHLPREWNGLKIYDEKGIGYIDKEIFKEKEMDISFGKISKKDFFEEYFDIIRDFKINKKVIVDFGGGATVVLGKKIWRAVCKNCGFIFDKVDPLIRSRHPEPREDTLSELKRVVKKFDFGLAYDYDGDRVVFLEKDFGFLEPEEVCLIHLLSSNGKKALLNVECFDIFSDFGIKTKFIPVGHDKLVDYSMKEKPDVGIEASGHITIPKYFYWDDGLLASIILSSSFDKKTLKEIPKIGRKRYYFKDIKYRNLIEAFKREFGEGIEIDGYRKEFDGWFFLLRKSKTEDKVKLTICFEENLDLNRIRQEINKVLGKFGLKI